MLDLIKTKERKQAILNLKKDNGIENQKAQVILCLDFSGSMGTLYTNGTVQDTVERILPLGLAFDDNQEVDFYLFHDSSFKLPENLNLKNIDGYINNKVIGKYNMGGTNYAPPLKQILKEFCKFKSGGFLGMGKQEPSQLEYPIYVIFITDGENFDKSETEQTLIECSKHGMFVQFVGIGGESFNFLQKLDDLKGRFLDNANFFRVPNLKNISDTELYSLLLKEFPDWSKEVKKHNLIK